CELVGVRKELVDADRRPGDVEFRVQRGVGLVDDANGDRLVSTAAVSSVAAVASINPDQATRGQQQSPADNARRQNSQSRLHATPPCIKTRHPELSCGHYSRPPLGRQARELLEEAQCGGRTRSPPHDRKYGRDRMLRKYEDQP